MNKFKNILILAGGDSTRFWPLENKNLLDFLDKRLIDYQIGILSQFSENIFLVCNQLINDSTDIIPSSNKIIQHPNLEGQAGAIVCAKNKIKGEVLIVNANDVFNPIIFAQLINQLKKDNNDLLLVAKKVKEYFPGGYLKFNNNKIAGIVEKPPIDKVPSDLTRLVVDYFTDFDKLVSALENNKSDSDDLYEVGINALIKQSEKPSYVLYEDFWYSLKYPWHLLPMLAFFLNKLKANIIGKGSVISDKAIIVPPVYIGENVKIGDFAKIVGPSYIDNNTIIADYALVRQSQIGKDCLIGSYSEVARSYINNKVMLHRNYVGDSVLDEGVLMGSGAVTANFRFDEKEVKSKVKDQVINSNLNKFGAIIGKKAKIGVNATLLPGVKIGQHAWIGPGEVVREDIKDEFKKFNQTI